MPTTEQHAPLYQRMATLAGKLYEHSYKTTISIDEGEYLRNRAAELAVLAQEVEADYVSIVGDEEWPTNAQGVALAAFLRRLNRCERRNAYASITKGGIGLSWDYLTVRLGDGYEGGIDPDGRVST